MMYKVQILLVLLLAFSCKEEDRQLSAQEIVDKSISVSGGGLYNNATIAFDFRERHYISEQHGNKKVLTRILKNDTTHLVDVLSNDGFQRFQADSLISIPDSLASKYGNSVNSVHYFSKLPFGLNDAAVNKEFLGEAEIKGVNYYKIKVTFNQAGGGDDFDDTYIYWFNKETFKPDYLAYDFHVDGGGMRFREAYNERYVNGIRFVDYKNLKPKNSNATILQIDSLYANNQLELLSEIELENVSVNQDSYN